MTRKNLFKAALFSVLFLLPLRLEAQEAPFSALDLRGMCTSTFDLDYGYCAGYISAVAHTLLTQSIGPHRACNHASVRSQQLVDTFNAWAEVFPDKLNQGAEEAAAAALARAFPCR